MAVSSEPHVYMWEWGRWGGGRDIQAKLFIFHLKFTPIIKVENSDHLFCP